jgi:translation elongation factor EF-G
MEEQIAKALSPYCVAFADNQTKSELDEKLALVHEDFLESFLSEIPIDDGEIAALVSERRLFPCVFGSALKMIGVDFLLDTLERYTLAPAYEEKNFAAKVYKIARVDSARLTYMKITGGTLSARDEISYVGANGKPYTEKVSQLRLYSGDKFDQTDSVSAGDICAVLGLSSTYVGQGLGVEGDGCKPILEPALSYCIQLPPECDVNLYFPKLKELEEEEPSLHLRWNETLRQIEAGLMGEIQIDLLKRMIWESLGIRCELDTGKLLYKQEAT